MHRIDHATAAPGDLFTEGNPATATPATTVTDDWLNDVQENICDVVETAGIALVKGDYTQLRQAIQAMLIASQKAVTISSAGFEASVANGEVVRWDAGNSRFDEAIADGSVNNRAIGIADVTNSKVYIYGECPLFSGLTPGARYYLSASTAGAVTDTAPADGVAIGIAKSATTLWVDVDAVVGGLTASDLQGQTKTAFTTAGTAPAFTLTPSPAIGAYAANQRFRVSFNAAGITGSNTLNVSGHGAKNLKQYDSTGTKVSGVIASGQLADVEYDGTDFVILDPLPPGVGAPSPVRQTVFSGPIDANGNPSFLPATSASLSLTSQNISTGASALVVSAANGFAFGGALDRIGYSTANLTWSGLTANTTNYLYVDVAVNGIMTPGSTTLAPNYQQGGTRSTISGQATFNIAEMSMTVGNGSTALQAYRVFVGEAVTGASSVTSTVAYAYSGKFVSTEFGYVAGTAYNISHNLGVIPRTYRLVAVCKTTDLGWPVGTELQADAYYNASHGSIDKNTNRVATYNGTIYQIQYGALSQNAMTLANWKLKYYIDRGW